MNAPWVRAFGPAAIAAIVTSASAHAEAPRVDVRAEVAQVMFAASATQAAAERAADDRLSRASREIERLRAQGETARLQLAEAQERYVADLAARDRAYAHEIAVLRKAAEDIAATPEGAAALARYNAGDVDGALGVLDQLFDARERARRARADIETAAERRRAARLAYDGWRRRGAAVVTATSVASRFEDVVRLDPDVSSDWTALRDLYADLWRRGARDIHDVIRAARRGTGAAESDEERADALYDWALALGWAGDWSAARSRYEECIVIERRLLARDSRDSADSEDLRPPSGLNLIRALTGLAGVLANAGDLAGARRRIEEAREIDHRLRPDSELPESTQLAEIAAAQGDFAYARRVLEKRVSDRRAQASADPASEPSQQLLAYSLQDYGELLSKAGDLEGMRAAHEEAIAVTRRLLDQARRPFLLNLSVALQRYRDSLISRGDFAHAAPVVDEEIETLRRFAATRPDDVEMEERIAAMQRRRAGVLIGLNEPAAARAACEEAAQTMKRLADANPQTHHFVAFYAMSLTCAGDALRAAGDLTDARARYEEARGLWIRLMASKMSMPRKPWYRALVHFGLAEIALDEGRKQDALADLRIARSVFQDYVEANTGEGYDDLYRWALLGAEFRLAQAQGDRAGVRRAAARLRELDRGWIPLDLDGWQPLHFRWADELRALAR